MSTGQAGDVLADLREAASERRTARRWLADLTAEHGNRSAARQPAQEAYAEATARWSKLIREAVAAGHTKADVARAAGCAAPSLYGTSRPISSCCATVRQREHSRAGKRRTDMTELPSFQWDDDPPVDGSAGEPCPRCGYPLPESGACERLRLVYPAQPYLLPTSVPCGQVADSIDRERL
jgi:hypothetical protein